MKLVQKELLLESATQLIPGIRSLRSVLSLAIRFKVQTNAHGTIDLAHHCVGAYLVLLRFYMIIFNIFESIRIYRIIEN